MRQFNALRFNVAVSVVVLASFSHAHAQPGKSNSGRKNAPSSGRAPAPAPAAIPVAAAIPQQHTYHQYNTYPSYAYPVGAASTGSFAAPYSTPAQPNVTYVNQYYMMPPYVPVVTPALAYYVPTRYGFGEVGKFPPFVPRYVQTGPKEATIEVLMTQSDADLHVDGTKTSASGLRRFFTSPPLEAGTYSYQVAASWLREGQEVRMERTVEVSPGGHYFVDFNKIELAASEASAKRN